MRLHLALVVGVALLGSACHQPTTGGGELPPPNPARDETWTLVWSDEFDGPAGARVDTTRWTYNIGDGCPSVCGWGNDEKEYYTSARENIHLNGEGQLVITARVAPAGLTCYYGPCRYTSAKLDTHHKLSAAPGKVAARIRLAAGQGLWPAFWMLGTADVGWPANGELDIMENHGSNMTSTSSAVHGPGYSGNTPFVHSRPLASGLYSDDFHVFAVAWDSTRIRFFVDDTLHYTVTRIDVAQYGNWVYDQPFYVLLNLAVGGHFDGDPRSNAIFPATMLVDWVRVYTRDR